MPSPRVSALFLWFYFWTSLISSCHSQTCTSQSFTTNTLYADCLNLPVLTSYLHFTYDSSNSTLSIAFIASPSKSGGWISWAINPTDQKMNGAQALVAYKDSAEVMTLKTYNISGYSSSTVTQSKLAFKVWDTNEEEEGEVMRLFAKIKVPVKLAIKGTVNQVWQVGPSVDDIGVLGIHDISGPNLNARGSLELNSGQNSGGAVTDSRTQKKNVNFILLFKFIIYDKL